MTITTELPIYDEAVSLADNSDGTPLPVSDITDKPPSYREPSIMTTMNEKKGEVELVTRNISASSTICPEAACPSRSPKAYSSTFKSRRGTCHGCCGKTSTSAAATPLSAPQVLSTSFALLNSALSGSPMHKPTNKAEAKANIEALKLVLKEVKARRQGYQLSCQEKNTLKRELGPLEDDVKGVLRDLKREKGRVC